MTIGVVGESIHEFTAWFKRYSWWDTNGGKASALLLIVALAAELITQITANGMSGRIIALLNMQAATLERDAGLTEGRLLDERRLTARERWRLERVERAVLPRSLNNPHQHDVLLPKLAGLGPINIAILSKQEPRLFGMQLVQLFQEAGIMGRLLWLPSDSYQSGVTTYAADARGRKLSEILWSERIGGSTLGGGVLPIGLEAIPKDEDALIVGENDAAFQPGSGQPGEGLDEHGSPVPAPR